MSDKVIHLRHGDRTQRLIGSHADAVAKKDWEPRGWTRFDPSESRKKAEPIADAVSGLAPAPEPTKAKAKAADKTANGSAT